MGVQTSATHIRHHRPTSSGHIREFSTPHSCRFRADVTGRGGFLTHSSRLTVHPPAQKSHRYAFKPSLCLSSRACSLSVAHSCRFRADMTRWDGFQPHSNRLTGSLLARHFSGAANKKPSLGTRIQAAAPSTMAHAI